MSVQVGAPSATRATSSEVPASSEVIASAADWGRLAGEWNELAAHVDGSSYFQTADWVASWWETVARQPATRVARWRSGTGALDAIAAVSRGRQVLHRRLRLSVPVSVLSGTGPGAGDHCGPLARPGRRADVAAWLRTAAGRTTLVASSVSAGTTPGIAPAGAHLAGRTACPRLVLDGAFDRAFDQALDRDRVGRSANFRRQLERYSRRLERAGVRFSWVPPGSLAAATIDELLALHHARRRGHGQATSLGSAHRELLLRCRTRATDGRGPAAVVASRDGAVVGVLLGFWWRGGFSAYQSGWDPAYEHDSLGSVLVAEAIRRVAAAGGHTFDFLRGAEPYKYRFGAVDAFDETSVIAHGPVGSLVLARAAFDSRAARH